MIQFFLRLIKIKHKSRKYFTLIPRIDLEKGIIFIAFKLRIYPRVLEIYLNSLRQKEVPNLPTFQTLSTSRYREISTCDFSSQQIIFICIFHCPSPLSIYTLQLHPVVFQLFHRAPPLLAHPYFLLVPSKAFQTKVATNPLSHLELPPRTLSTFLLSLLVKSLASPFHHFLRGKKQKYATNMRRMKGSTLSLDICQPRGRIPPRG